MLRPWKIVMAQRLRIDSGTPLYMQIVHALIHEIQRGRLQPGTYLPSTRDLAATLGVNRKTIVIAYDELVAQGWLVSEGTKGTIVSTSLPDNNPRNLDHNDLPSAHVDAPVIGYPFRPPPDRPLAIPAGDWLKLDEGAPDGRLFPTEILARAYRTAALRATRERRLLYRDPRGSTLLRESIATMLRDERGLMVSVDNICITRGSQMGIYLAARILSRPGSAVLVEELTYEPAVAAFRACGAEIVPVRLDSEGLDVQDVERLCRKHKVCAIFLTPHHQFPTTVSLRPERRLRLLELARQFGFAVIEDDYDHEFRFGSQPLLPMASYAPDRVVYVGSLSKLLLPALRIGYLAAPREVIDAVSYEVSLIDGMGNTITEDAAAELIDSGEVRRHARKANRVYAERRDAFTAVVDEAFGDMVDVQIPDGGLALWLRFRDIVALDRIERRAARLGLSFAASHSFMARDEAPRGLRLGFASLKPEEACEAILALRRAAKN
jgi:GntR family transcriptional regulator / MocR family aminotransferase